MLGLVGPVAAAPRPRRSARSNDFNYHAILEVAALFIGIFIAMQIPIEILNAKGPSLGLTKPWHFFWATGSLSAFLDNAPTYVVFFTTAESLTHRKARPERDTDAGRRAVRRRVAAGRHLAGCGVHGRDELHRQRAELHGQEHRRTVRHQDAQLLRLHVLQHDHPAAAVRFGHVDLRTLATISSGRPPSRPQCAHWSPTLPGWGAGGMAHACVAMRTVNMATQA